MTAPLGGGYTWGAPAPMKDGCRAVISSGVVSRHLRIRESVLFLCDVLGAAESRVLMAPATMAMLTPVIARVGRAATPQTVRNMIMPMKELGGFSVMSGVTEDTSVVMGTVDLFRRTKMSGPKGKMPFKSTKLHMTFIEPGSAGLSKRV